MKRLKNTLVYLAFRIFGRETLETHYNGHGDFEEFLYLKLFRYYLDIDSEHIYRF